MYIGSLQVRLLVREALTLKDKRRVLRSLKDRLRNTFNAAVAEVDAQDRRQTIILGIATVSNDPGHAERQARQILDWLARQVAAELVDHQLEVL